MILIVADAGPVNYLIQIGQVGVLAELADRIVLPVSVRAELLHDAAPDAVRAWNGAEGSACDARHFHQGKAAGSG